MLKLAADCIHVFIVLHSVGGGGGGAGLPAS